MRDYTLLGDDGRMVPVSEMPMIDIMECLVEGFDVADPGVSEAAIRDRLELEVFIRKENLRCE